MRAQVSTLVGALALSACQSGGGSGNTDPGGDFGNIDECTARLVEVWNPNHGHSVLTEEFLEQVDTVELYPHKPLVIGAGRAGHTHTLDPSNRRLQAFLFGDSASVTLETDVNSLHSHKVTVNLSFPSFCGDLFDDGFDGDGIPPQIPGNDDG